MEDPLLLEDHQEVVEDHLAEEALELVEVTGSWEATPLQNSQVIAPSWMLS